MSDHFSVSVEIGGEFLSLDPRTGKYENCDHPHCEWDAIAKPHTVTVVHADGSSTEVTIVGAKYRELNDDDFVVAVCTGDWDRWLTKRKVTKEQWHEYLVKLQAKQRGSTQ